MRKECFHKISGRLAKRFGKIATDGLSASRPGIFDGSSLYLKPFQERIRTLVGIFFHKPSADRKKDRDPEADGWNMGMWQ